MAPIRPEEGETPTNDGDRDEHGQEDQGDAEHMGITPPVHGLSTPYRGVWVEHVPDDTGVGIWDAGCPLATRCGNTPHSTRHALWSLSLPVPYWGSDRGGAEVFSLGI